MSKVKILGDMKQISIDWDDTICCVITVSEDTPTEVLNEIADEIETKPHCIMVREGMIQMDFVLKSELEGARDE